MLHHQDSCISRPGGVQKVSRYPSSWTPRLRNLLQQILSHQNHKEHFVVSPYCSGLNKPRTTLQDFTRWPSLSQQADWSKNDERQDPWLSACGDVRTASDLSVTAVSACDFKSRCFGFRQIWSWNIWGGVGKTKAKKFFNLLKRRGKTGEML